MFLCPQHLQAFGRELGARVRVAESVGIPGAFGLLRVEIDEEALARDVFVLERATVVFKDGSVADLPGTANVEPREFAALFTGTDLAVELGVRAIQDNVPQIDSGADGFARYKVRTEVVFDENLRDSSKELEFRELQARLFFGDEDRTGYETVPLARIVRRGKPVAKSVLSPSYVPPILAVGASSVLTKDLRELAQLLRTKALDLAPRIPATSGLASAQRGADISAFVKLQAINQCLGMLDQVAAANELHPFDAYLCLCQCTANLAIFGPKRVVPDLPAYDHLALETAFTSASRAIRALVGEEVTQPYATEAFREIRPGIFGCALQDTWVDQHAIVYLGVEVAQKSEAVITAAGDGLLKVGAPTDEERMLTTTTPIIQLAHERVPPVAFPRRENLHYFRIHSEAGSREGWLRVAKARSIVLTDFTAWDGIKFHLYVETPGS